MRASPFYSCHYQAQLRVEPVAEPLTCSASCNPNLSRQGQSPSPLYGLRLPSTEGLAEATALAVWLQGWRAPPPHPSLPPWPGRAHEGTPRKGEGRMQLAETAPPKPPPERTGPAGRAGESPPESWLRGPTAPKVAARQGRLAPVTCVAVVGQWVGLQLLGSSE